MMNEDAASITFGTFADGLRGAKFVPVNPTLLEKAMKSTNTESLEDTVIELDESELAQVAGGTALANACATGKHIDQGKLTL